MAQNELQYHNNDFKINTENLKRCMDGEIWKRSRRLYWGKLEKHRTDVFQAYVHLDLNKCASYNGQTYIILVCCVVATLPKNIIKLVC